MAFLLLQYDLTSMKIILPCSTSTILLLAITYYYCVHKKWVVSAPKGKATAPEASGGWPIIGHLLLLKGPTPSHKTLGVLADKHGPIFLIRTGSHRALIISSSEVARECFTTNDLVLASRPSLLAAKHMGYNKAMFGLSPHGLYWREIRKIATVELLSNHRLEMLKHVRVSEVDVSITELHNHWMANNNKTQNVTVDMKQWFSDLTLNVTLRMVAGKRYSWTAEGSDDDAKESRVVQKAINQFFTLIGLFVPGDAIPSLAWLDLGGYVKAMKKTSNDLDVIFSEWLREHRLMREAVSVSENRNERDFMDVMLSALEGSSFAGFDTDTIIKATVLNIIAGGIDTTTVTLTWAISLLLNNHDALKKAQDELDLRVGKTRVVDVSDIAELSYIQAIIKETMRLYPAAPLSAPHVATADCTIGGYHVPKGTRVISNLWKIQTDPVLWADPLEFKPERFLEPSVHGDIDVRGQHFELIPFGSGRRSCPGITFALQILHLTLARFLQGFDISTRHGVRVDMTESFGLTNLKATPLDVVINPRLPAELYG